jgi:hypothetical protein
VRVQFTLVKRMLKEPKPHTVYYYRQGVGPERTLCSTGQTSCVAAEEWVRAQLSRFAGADVTRAEYAADFFIWGHCHSIER